MYDENFNKLINFIFESEGGYSNNPYDKGGKTNYGITHSIYDEWNRRHKLPLKDVKNITKKEAADIYYEWFWKESGANNIEDLREAYLLFDMAVNSGPHNAKRVFKESDGDIYKYLENRKQYYRNIAKENPSQAVFLNGWMNRIKDLEKNINKIINSGLYIPPYQNDITIYDKEYKYSNLLDPYKINNKNTRINTEEQKEKVQNARNRFLYEKHKRKQISVDINTGFAAPIQYDKKDPFIQGFDGEKKDDRSPSQKTADEINNDKWDSNDISFLEGFHSKDKDNHLIKEAKNKRKEKAKSKGNEGKGPNGEDGYWYTTKTGKHVFVPDD